MTVVRKNDKGLKNMMAVMAQADGKVIDVGIFFTRAVKSRNGSDDDLLANRYKKHDKGIGVPKRETLIPSFDETLKSDPLVKKFLSFQLDKGTGFFGKQIADVGNRFARNVQQEIIDLKTPAKAESTILQAQRRYGGRRANPLIQTSEMKNAVKFRVRK